MKDVNDLGYQSAGHPVVSGQETVLLRKPLATVGTDIAPLAQVQEGVPSQRRGPDLLTIVVHTARPGPTAGTKQGQMYSFRGR